jgi:hypothetical protein
MTTLEELNFDNLKLMDVLLASPYHPKTVWLTKDRFKEELLIKYNNYNELKIDIEKQLEEKPHELPFFHFLKGYAGTGKTTFIHWFCDECKDKIKYAFLDFSDTDDVVHEKRGDRKDYEYQLENCLRPLVSLLIDQNQNPSYDMLKHLYEKRGKLFAYFAPNFFKTLKTVVADDKIDNDELIDFSFSLRYSELFLLLLLFYNKYEKPFLSCTNGNTNLKSNQIENNNLLLFIDNLDSIKMETFSKDIPKHFVSTYRQYLNIIGVDYEYFNKRKKIDFIYCVRDTIHSVINPQEEDLTNIRTINFTPNINETKQYSQRLKFAKKHKIKVNKETELLLGHIFGDNATKKSYMPLFNYNNRKIVSYIHRIALESDIFLEPIRSLIKTKSKSSTVGVRGIYYFLFLKFMKEKDFFNEALFSAEGYFVEEGAGEKTEVHINPIRIILTILLNLCRYHLDIELRHDYAIKVGFFDLYLEYKKIFERLKDKEQCFCNIIARLFLFYENNWCHLVTLTNKEILDLDSFNDEVKLLQAYERDQDEEIRKTLNRIKINLNAAGYIYLKDIVRHYEFFSVRANVGKPLFASLCIKNVDGELTYEFMDNIKKTFELAENCIQSLTDFLQIKRFKDFEESNSCYRLYSKEDSIEGDFDSRASFYDNNKKNGHLLINRIIDYHTEYIDNLRVYLSNNHSLIQEYSTKLCKTENEIILDINSKILEIIDKYVSLYYLSTNQYDRKVKEIHVKNIKHIKELIYQKKMPEIKEATLNDNRE